MARQSIKTRETIDLSGKWTVTLNSWTSSSETIKEEVTLPGTLDEHGLGPIPQIAQDRLTRNYAYEGPACYERRVFIPESWREKTILFSMERTRVSEVFVNGVIVGSQNSLSTPHCYDLTDYLSTGEHVIAVKVDNACGIMGWASVRNSHMASEHTQTNWNGILGKIELTTADDVRIERGDVHSQNESQLLVTVRLVKASRHSATLKLLYNILDHNDLEVYQSNENLIFLESDQEATTVSFLIQPDLKLKSWNEFQPALYTIRITIKGTQEGTHITDEREFIFGLRTFRANGTQFTINGQTTFLRGKHDGCVFPLTGYAPMSTEAWLHIFQLAKDYGINHYRFHSWCPPEAAFEAADQLGMYLQPELPLWNPGSAFEDDDEWSYFVEEAIRILDKYGHHPSFIMFAWGNELSGSEERMEELVETAREHDPSKLYAIGSNNFFLNARKPRNSDYWTTFWTEGSWNVKKAGFGGKHVRGATPHPTRGHINNNPPSGCKDYSEELRDVTIPVISHEVGQFQIHPDFSELKKYCGVLKPYHLERTRDQAIVSGLLPQAEDFQGASGRLAALCYREEIEATLRTPGMAGFQLLDLQDFPGQGGAYVGILDSFMETKGVIAPEEWRSFCSEIVPLVRLSKYTWTAGETIIAPIEVAQYGPEDLSELSISWVLFNDYRTVIAEGKFENLKLPQGKVIEIGTIVYEIPDYVYPQHCSLCITLEGTTYSNMYSIWMYPKFKYVSIPSSILVADTFDDGVKQELRDGKTVLLLPRAGESFGDGPNGAFIPDFWCYSMFKKYNPPGTLGIICDSSHPALASFPTAVYAEWQWWHIMKNSRAFILDEAGPDYRPIVQVIDNVARQHRLGLIFEAKVNEGRLLICSIDLWSQQDRPEARQLLQGLFDYCASEQFVPSVDWTEALVERLFYKKVPDEVAGNPNADMFG